MTEPAGAVNVVSVAGINPKMETIAVFNSRVSAPNGLGFTGHSHGDQNARFVPS
jgi:hypothetical protein